MPLFDRIGRRSELTPFGREVLAARPAAGVRGRRTARQRPAACARAQRGALRIGMGSGPGAMLMTPLLLQMALQHPACT